MDGRRFDRWAVSFAAHKRHRRGVLRAITGVALAGRLVPLAGSNEAAADKRGRRKLTAECAGPPDTTTTYDDGDVRLAQTFTANLGGPLSRIRLTLHKEEGSSGDWLVRISPVDGSGRPTAEVLAESTINDALLPPGDLLLLVDFGKSKAAKLIEGTSYALVVSRPGASQVGLRTRSGNPCSGAFFVDCRGTFQTVSGIDLPLLAYVGFR
jgi:hypothetical protein